ncbi:hypothetical protein J5N97_012798 [Dioscorea zingiberensis]|uniref:Phytocyanin domain-containing protein n=1 Tax=Dioscorea zingiberensis TaxID=325984 RepID=A0A9D5CQX1_9LILI|nr:hypothetical protein J5N97_012798 [Dioscorea zingiberensis]
MASPSPTFITINLSLLLTLFSSTPVSSFEFQVGGASGWSVPSSKDSQFYNHWASDNRFKIGDTINFKYEKDSVMVVGEEDYDKCDSAHPVFFSNSGNTVFSFDRSGMFYFISGIAEHCQKGQKMIIKVMGHSEGPGTSPAAGNHTGGHTVPGSSPSASQALVLHAMPPFWFFLVFFIGSLFF